MPVDPTHSDDQPPKSSPDRLRRLVIAAASIVWICGIAIGVTELKRFETTPGGIAPTPAKWPVRSTIELDSHRSTLVMLIHPECSCTQASLSELAEVMQRAHGRINAWVIFVQARNTPHSATWNEAAHLLGTHIGIDPTGAEAMRFGALTSGHVVLYDTAGRLLFSGGITGARGHAGENMGRNQLLAALDTTLRGTQRHPVFGCSLEADNAPRPVSTGDRLSPPGEL